MSVQRRYAKFLGLAAIGALSIGLAESPRHGRPTAGLLAAADRALYAAKHGGRNLVEIARDT